MTMAAVLGIQNHALASTEQCGRVLVPATQALTNEWTVGDVGRNDVGQAFDETFVLGDSAVAGQQEFHRPREGR